MAASTVSYGRTAAAHGRAGSLGVAHLSDDLLQATGGHQGAELGLAVEGIPHRDSLALRGEVRHEPIVKTGRDEQAGAGEADLGLAGKGLREHAVDRLVPIDRLAYDDRALSAELENRGRDGLDSLLENFPAAFRSAGEDDLSHLRMLDDLAADRAARTGDDIDLSGATTDGLTTIVFPQATAAPKPRAISFKGVFHGTI